MKQRRHTVRSIIEKQLTPEQRATVHDWLREKLTYKQIVKRIYGAWGIRLSEGALGTYYQRRFLAAEMRRMSEERGVPADGVQVNIFFPEPGRVQIVVLPIHN